MINLPSETKEWKQQNQSDLFGNIFITKNITFDTEGYIRLSYSSRASIDESVDTDFNNPAVILFSEDYGYFVETWEEAFQVSTEILSVRPTQIVTAGVPSGDIQADAIFFGGLMPVSQDTDLDYYNPSSGTWVDTNITLTNTSQSQHPIVNFLSLSALAVANINTVTLYQAPLVAAPIAGYTLVINSDFFITGMCYFNQFLYIATMNRYGGHAFMYVWNGLGTAAQQVYEVDSNIIFSICVHQDAVWLFIGSGALLRFNGGSFDGPAQGIQAFPIYYTDQSLTDETNINIYKNVMKSNGDVLYILFNNQSNSTTKLLTQPDGIWCYDSTIGLYHRYPVSNSLVGNENILGASVNTTNNTITVTGNYTTGTEVVFTSVFGLSPLIDGTKYYVIRVDATHIKLANTFADCQSNTEIDLISSGSSNLFTFFPNIDFGQFFSKRTMALNVIERPVARRIYGTDLLWGAEVVRRDDTGDYGTLGTVSSEVQTRGYFITPKIFSGNVTDTFNRVSLKFSKFTSELDSILIKYRTYDDMRYYITLNNWAIIWTSINTFTTTQTEWSQAKTAFDTGEKWEVEILQGAGAGILAHISAISINTGTYTITLDENYDYYASGDIGIAVFKNWIKWKTITYGDSNALQYFLSEQLGATGKFIQFKVELRGVQTRIEELLVDNIYRLPAKK